ncbi:MAG: AmmeMemoRadiSam system protein B [Candidatus Omnitrophica bacterium]|nr:AmmeMemoRadiSam system protein B [Candidatus Omnitrophota bacterium]
MNAQGFSQRFRWVLFVIAVSFQMSAGSCCASDIKHPNVAGQFYPSDPELLSAMVEECMKEAPPAQAKEHVLALIVPHAGYGFSGKIAASGYNLIKNKPYTTVVVIGASHHVPFSQASIYAQGGFQTPLGVIPVDVEFAKQLLDKDEEIVFKPEVFDKEHSIEVQLPFLQKSLTDFRIVPILMGRASSDTCKKLAGLLQAAIGARQDVLVVASSDMYHGYDAKEAEKIDAKTIACLKTMDPEELFFGLHDDKYQMCGGLPVVVTLLLAKNLSLNTISILAQTNSAEVTGNTTKGDWTVGYMSAAIQGTYKGAVETKTVAPAQTEGEKTMFNQAQKDHLLQLARNSIETFLKTGKKLEVTETDPALMQEMGAFVTLNSASGLRGCIGSLIGAQPLYLTVRDMAVEAAVGDPRFPSVKLDELKRIHIEISALSPLERVPSADAIKLGTHGVIVRRGGHSGVFLPQVATETGWSKEEFLSELCSQKAGLAPDAWKDPSTELYVFTAEVFSEKDR